MDVNERMIRLVFGNIGDEIALKNICEAQYEDMEGLTKKDRDFLIHTNQFYYSMEDFCELHEASPEDFQELMKDGDIVKTTDGYVYKNGV